MKSGSTAAFSDSRNNAGILLKRKRLSLSETINHPIRRNRMTYHVRAETSIRSDDRRNTVRSGKLNHNFLFCLFHHISPLECKLIGSTQELNISSQEIKIDHDIDSIFSPLQYNFLSLEWAILNQIRFAYLQSGVYNELLFL